MCDHLSSVIENIALLIESCGVWTAVLNIMTNVSGNGNFYMTPYKKVCNSRYFLLLNKRQRFDKVLL